jgi:putative ABC transport system permease protein
MERAKEAGVRKILGAEKHQLAFQFIIDALFLQLLAMLLCLSMLAMLPYVSDYLSAIDLPLINWAETSFLLVLLGVFLTGIIVLASYPAFVLSATNAQTIMRGNAKIPKSSSTLRQYMVTFQFASSIALLIITGLVYKQIAYMRSQNLGININQTLVVKAPRITEPSYQQRTAIFKQEMLQANFVTKATTSSEIPGRPFGSTRVIVEPQGSYETANKYTSAWIDEDFMSLFEIKLLAGRNFSPEFRTDNQAIIINEALMKALHFDNPEKAIGQEVMAQGAGMCSIIGVIQNYHHQSLANTHLPAAFFYNNSRSRNFFSLKLNKSQPFAIAIQAIEKKWKAVFPENPFEYFFLDEFYNRQYKQDEAFGRSISIFSAFSILIACVGLFGLASFFTAQRTKEISIRKVLGASTTSVLVLLTKDFLKPVLLSILIAWPVSWWVIHKWLENYAFHTGIDWSLFMLPSLLIVFIALLTVSFQTIKAALANPSKILRNE